MLKAQPQADGNSKVDAPPDKALRRITVMKTAPTPGAKAVSSAKPETSTDETMKIEMSPGASPEAAESSQNESKPELTETPKKKSKAKAVKDGPPARRVHLLLFNPKAIPMKKFSREDHQKIEIWMFLEILQKNSRMQ